MRSLLAMLRILLAVVLFALALAAVSPVHIPPVEPFVLVATEWGHLWCIAALGILCSGIGDSRGAASFVLASASLLLLGSPLVRSVLSPAGAGIQTVADVYRAEVAEPAAPTVVETLGQHTLSLYSTDTQANNPAPVILAVASRDGISSNVDTYLPWLQSLTREGYHVVTIDWEDKAPDPLTDLPVAGVVRWVRAHAQAHGLDADHIVLFAGEKAGSDALVSEHASLAARIAWAPTHAKATRASQASPALVLCPERGTVAPEAPCSDLASSPAEHVALPWATRNGLAQPHGPTSSTSRSAVSGFLQHTFSSPSTQPEVL